MSNIADVLKQAAKDAGPEKKPKLKKAAVTEIKEKVKRAPKMVPALNEDGTPQLDADGNPVMVAAPKKERVVKLDENGNPIVKERNVFLPEQKIHLTEKGKTTKYREGSKRQTHFATIFDGMTVAQYYEANGGKAASHRYLVHQLNVLDTITID